MAKKSSKIIEQGEHRNASTDSVERIRDIIFGQQIEDYSSKFAQIASHLSTIDNRLEQIDNRIAEHERDVDSQLENQRKKFEDQLTKLDSEFTHQLEEMTLQNQQRADGLSKNLAALKKSAKKELQTTAAELTDLKVDRSALSDLFVQFGQTLVATDSQPAAADSAKAAKSKRS